MPYASRWPHISPIIPNTNPYFTIEGNNKSKRSILIRPQVRKVTSAKVKRETKIKKVHVDPDEISGEEFDPSKLDKGRAEYDKFLMRGKVQRKQHKAFERSNFPI